MAEKFDVASTCISIGTSDNSCDLSMLATQGRECIFSMSKDKMWCCKVVLHFLCPNAFTFVLPCKFTWGPTHQNVVSLHCLLGPSMDNDKSVVCPFFWGCQWTKSCWQVARTNPPFSSHTQPTWFFDAFHFIPCHVLWHITPMSQSGLQLIESNSKIVHGQSQKMRQFGRFVHCVCINADEKWQNLWLACQKTCKTCIVAHSCMTNQFPWTTVCTCIAI